MAALHRDMIHSIFFGDDSVFQLKNVVYQKTSKRFWITIS